MSSPQAVDVAILGAGFGGSLLAIVLRRLGLSVALFDRQVHPRFAIGESSTPAADFVLERLCAEYDLPRIRPLARYGSWRRTYPEISRGLKRGFSYFHHRPGEPFQTDANHSTELLVSASVNDDVSDTHWYRAEVDQFFCREAVREGATVEEGVETEVEILPEGWRVGATRRGQPVRTVEARFLVDGAGAAGVLPRQLGLRDLTGELETNSRSVFVHVDHLARWEQLLVGQGISVAEHPYPCDEAALHHICDGGWMWVLRFENGITSAGFALDIDRHPLDDSLSPEEEFHRRLAMYPSIEEQFRPTRMSESFPSRVPIRTGRMQRLWDHAAGDRWCLLPNAAGFIDPFYSTGIAQTLCGVLRLGDAFRNWNRPETFLAKLAAYDRLVVREVRLIDQIVAASYASMGADPDLLHAASALYFAAATTFEQRFHGRSDLPAFLLADDPQFVGLVRLISGQIRETARQGAGGDVAGCVSATAAAIAPYNVAGLLAPEARHLYRRTAAK